MSEKALRNIFIFGTLFFFVILVAMTVDTLRQVNNIRTPPLTDQVVEGKRAWQSKNCDDCHTILGIGGYFAPELTKVFDRRGAPWLSNWLKDPLSMDPAATMPNQHLDSNQVANLVAFFEWVSKIDTNNWPPAPILVAGGAAGSQPTGAQLFVQKSCSACHRINGSGAAGPGPDLSHIGGQPYDALLNTPDFLAKWLANPVAQKPGTLMPRLGLSDADIQSLVEYLTSLK
jgi:nitric oxide reductase subunit C